MCKPGIHNDVPRHTDDVYPTIYILLLLAFMMITDNLMGQQITGSTSTISGTVTDDSGTPLELVNVRIKGTTSGTVSDSLGQFSVTTQDLGSHTLIGFADKRKPINLKPGATINLDIILRKELFKLDELQVSASSFTTGDAESVTLNPLEVITTPGAAADMFRAVKTFPGISTVDEGSSLFVRGGDVSETKILLDQATVAHPYCFESPTGGARGTIPPFLVKGTYFSSGGFSARYGDTLSAVLSMESLGMPQSTSINLNLGMAAASAGLSTPIVHDKLGVRFSGNRSFTQFLFEVNGQADEFHRAPMGLDGNLSLIYKPSMFGGSTEGAIKEFKKAAELFKSFEPVNKLMPNWGHAENYAWLGQAYEQNEQYNEAQKAYQQALELDPNYQWVKFVLMPQLIEKMK